MRQWNGLAVGWLTTLLPYAILALPFLTVVILLDGLIHSFNAFHGLDEIQGHYPAILLFEQDFFGAFAREYPTSTPPFYYLLMALVGKVVGFELFKLRLANALISYLAVVALFRLLASYLGMVTGKAFLLALVFALSPYFFGISFLLLTDNLGLLLFFLTLIFFIKWRGNGELRHFFGACVMACAAMLTRQVYIFLLGIGLYYLLRTQTSGKSRLAGLAMLVASFTPLGLIMLFVWGGPAPTSFETETHISRLPNAKSLLFLVALYGLYGLFIETGQAVQAGRQLLRGRYGYLALVLVVATVLIVLPVQAVPRDDEGVLWRLAFWMPELVNTELFFWLLTPVGAILMYESVRRCGGLSLFSVYLGSFAATMSLSRPVFQKYYDPFVLLLICIAASSDFQNRRLEVAGAGLLATGFLLYAWGRPLVVGQ